MTIDGELLLMAIVAFWAGSNILLAHIEAHEIKAIVEKIQDPK